MLDHGTYEILRWVVAVVLPALSILLISLNDIWQWNAPVNELALTLDALGLFLGSVFGLSKIVNDKKTKKTKK